MAREIAVDILIVGGGTGGCAAAMAATTLGHRVLMTEETTWIGGQFTSQAVPADEHPWIESHGCTRRYRVFRNRVRQYYRDHYALNVEARSNQKLNPGNGWVSRICMEPRVALAVLEGILMGRRSSGSLQVMLETVPVSAEVDGDRVTSVTVRSITTGELTTIRANQVLDATELGDLFPLTGTEYRVGSDDFDELHDPGKADPLDVQGFTWCFAAGFDPGGHHVIEKPRDYDKWNARVPQTEPEWPGKLFSWTVPDAATLAPRTFPMFGHLGMFTYRRIIDGSLFDLPKVPNDVTIVNWAQNDFFFQRVIDEPAEVVAKAYDDGRQQSLSFFYWLQTEAPRDEGGYGYPELYLAGDAVGTHDGLAMAPYHRESRRLEAEFMVTEHHVGVKMRAESGSSEKFADSVGVGAYRIDLHPSAVRNSVDLSSYPFQIPLGSLIPVRMENLIPACKNLGVSHIANGCYRLHPVEWNIGEAAGLLAAFALSKSCSPRAVRNSPELLAEFQRLCVAQGFELDWPSTRAL